MTPAEALARRAVACKRWRWMPGMSDVGGGVLCAVSADGAECAVYARGVTYFMLTRNLLPDFDDPATRGCLLALVREAHGDPGGHTTLTGWGDWACVVSGRAWYADEEVEAMVKALEAAP